MTNFMKRAATRLVYGLTLLAAMMIMGATLATAQEAGYWVSYSRTAGDSPLVMITMQKTP